MEKGDGEVMASKSKGMTAASSKAKTKPKGAKATPAKAVKPAKALKGAKPTKVVTPAPKIKEIAKVKEALRTEAAKPVAAPKEKASRSRKISVSASADEAASALAQKWANLFKKSSQIEAKPYNMKNTFEEKTAIVHKVLGWGYILANRNDRLEVLFKDGIKYLISNYKA